MTFSEFLNLIDLLNLKSELDLENKKVSLNLLFFSIKNISFKTVKSLAEDQNKVEDILNELFIRKQVMWQDFQRENVAYCLESLVDLKSKLNKWATDFQKTKKEKDRVYSSLLKNWGNLCDEAAKEFKTAIEYEEIGKKTEFDSEFILRVADEIPKILKEFRSNSYPIVSALIGLLPKNNPIGVAADDKLSFGQSILIKYYGAEPKELKEYSLEIEK